LGESGSWGTPPDPRQEGSCASFSAFSLKSYNQAGNKHKLIAVLSVLLCIEQEKRKILMAILTRTTDIVSNRSRLIVNSTNVVLAWLGGGTINRLFWMLVRIGSIDAAITILIIGYIASHFDSTIRETIRRILMS
jgi:hypothetical protein